MKHVHLKCVFKYTPVVPHGNTRGVVVIKGIATCYLLVMSTPVTILLKCGRMQTLYSGNNSCHDNPYTLVIVAMSWLSSFSLHGL